MFLFNAFTAFIQEYDVQIGYGIPLRHQKEAADRFKRLVDQYGDAAAYVASHGTYSPAFDYLLDYRREIKRFDERGALAYTPSASHNLYLVMKPDEAAGAFLNARASTNLLDAVELPGKRQSFQLFSIPREDGFAVGRAAEFRPVEVFFDNGIRLRGFQITPRASPGGSAKVALLWGVERSFPEPRADFVLFAHIVDADGHQHGGEDVASYPSSEWQAGEEFVTWHDVLISTDAPMGQHWLETGFYDRRTLERAAAYDGERKPLGSSVRLGPFKVSSPSAGDSRAVTPPGHRVQARLGSGAMLESYTLEPEHIRAWDRVRLTLYWRALEEMERDYTVFVHLIDGGERVLAQRDSQPVGGRYPTSLWDRDEVVRDEHELAVPVDAQPGRFRVVVGMYTWPDLKRLEVQDSTGRRLGDRVLLEEITVGR